MFRAFVFLLVATCCLSADSAEQAIRRVLNDQAQAWNRGDIDTYMTGYDNSPETTFIGKTVQHGYQNVLRNYHERYPTRERMGTLTFTDLTVKLLSTEYASVTGQFHLQRTAAAGGDTSGVFSLLFHRTRMGWKVILDHTS
ncbi:MAG TPA: nuclear transport factor 2 family protein [Bryobacteraceae bacterium]|nr:nuclear transport factor 2 family protein [Bryobacteraceae bacterium]